MEALEEGLEDTIVAVATPPGPGGLAVVRLSGPHALAIGRALVGTRELGAPRVASLFGLRDPGDGALLDRALVTVFPGPASYTGEDVVEVSTHGGRVVPARVLEVCRSLGARQAEGGEFTRRAYLNGKLDLIQAEAVADLVEGRSRALQETALFQLERGLSRRLGELRDALVQVEALLMYHVDFPDEDEPPVGVDEVLEAARALEGRLAELLATAPQGRLLREGALTVLAGRPNSGKSSLFNALLGEERAIVTAIPGTTRDAVDAVVSVGGFPFRLVDTAGLRPSDDEVERIGIEVAHGLQRRAEIVLFCLPANAECDAESESYVAGLPDSVKVVFLRTFSDLARSREGTVDATGALSEVPSIRTSVVSGEGMEELQELLPRLAFHGRGRGGAGVPVLTRERQAEGVRQARDEVALFCQCLEWDVPADVADTHLREAAAALDEVVGVVPLDSVLDRVFRDFCIGK
ncbi:MAG: tRNA uridine-5-carboxymethylaminomethyl(34) synthesis GTPase MnmE [Gemmatimonadota bacterium]